MIRRRWLGFGIWGLGIWVSLEAAPAVDIGALKDEVAGIRGLAFKKEFAASAIDREGLAKVLAEELAHEVPPEKLRTTARVYSLLGLVPEGFDLGKATLEVLTLGVGGIYIPRRTSLYHLSDLSGMALPILAHEVQHALQDQHWPITPRDDERKADSDRMLAYHAVVEGDAMAVMAEYAKRNPGTARLAGEELAQQFFNSAKIGEYPPILSEPMTMPYVQGHRFVNRIREKGGWKGVDALLDRPPESTEQILHPEKFLAGDDPPVKVALPDLAPVLGEGWKKTEEDVFGEWMISVAVRILTDDAVRGLRAAAGWGGDRFALYEKGAGAVLFWGSVWDTERDALEFADSLGVAFGSAARRWIRHSGKTVFAALGDTDERRAEAAAKLFEKGVAVK